MKILPIILAASAAAACSPAVPESDIAAVRGFISASWDTTVRYNPSDSLTLIGLPHPYTVPCADGMFQELYYWDTYFTNEGLAADGRAEQAKNNTDDLLYLADRFGYVPNGSRTWYLNRSQPPFLAMMVDRIYSVTGDRVWLARAFATLQREYDFWMTRRITPVGLNRYSSEAGDSLKREFVATAGSRLGADFAAGLSDAELLRTGAHLAAEAESGWDFNPRFHGRCEDFCPVDLNANLYMYETLFARFAAVLGDADASAEWLLRAERRLELVERFCSDEEGLYYDYDWRSSCRSDVVSGAVFSLLYAGIPDEARGRRLAAQALGRLECECGLAVCENKPYGRSYQWSYPNMWPPVVVLAIRGLDRYGLHDDARRIAAKYVAAAAATFRRTGNLWEKYDARDGGVDSASEYGTPAMAGWSAGAFVVASDRLGCRKNDNEPVKTRMK